MKSHYTIGLAAVAVIALTSWAQAQDITFAAWGGSYQKAERIAFLDKIEKKYGIKVAEDSHTGLAAIKTQVLSGKVFWDIVDLSTPDCERGRKQGLWEKLDYDVLPNAKDVEPVYKNDYWLGFITYSTVIAWNKDVKNPPTTWAEFWDVEKFPGKRALRSRARDMLEVALLADGVPIDQLYPLDVERAYKKLEQIRPHVSVWWTSGGQTAQMMKDDEVDMMIVWNGRAHNAIQDGANWEYSFNEGNIAVECLVVPKGAPNKEQAMKSLNEFIDAANGAEFTQHIPYGPVNAKAYEGGMIPPETLRRLPSAPQNLKVQFFMDPDWWSSSEGEVAEARWTSFLQQ